MIEISEPWLRRYLDRLETIAENPPAKRHQTEIIHFAETLCEDLRETGMSPEQQDRIASRVMLLLYAALLETEDADLRGFYLQCLAVFKIKSLPFFLAYLQRIADGKISISDMLGEYPPLIRAFAVNDILENPLDVPEKIATAALGFLPWFKELKPRLAIRFLLDLSLYECSVAFPVQEALKTGIFWETALQRIEDLSDMEEETESPSTSDFIECLALFRSPELIEMLSAFIERHDKNPPESIFKVYTRLGRADDVKAFKSVSKLLLHPSKDFQAKALNTLAAIAPRELGRIYAALCKKDKTLRPLIVRLLPFAPSKELAVFLASMSTKQRRRTLDEIFAACIALDPVQARACLHSAAESGGYPPETLDAIESRIPASEPSPTYEEVRKASGKKAPLKPDWEARGSNKAASYDIDDPYSPTAGDFETKNYSARLIRNADLSARMVRRADFSNSAMEDMAISNVFFQHANFSRALFKNVRFENCAFERCDFEDTEFHDSVINNIDCNLCNFEGAVFSGCEILQAKTSESVFTGARYIDTRLLTSRISNCDLSRLRMSGCEVRGVEFLYCTLEHIYVEQSLFETCSFACTHFWDARIVGLATDSPELLRRYRDSLIESAGVCELPEPPKSDDRQSGLIDDAVTHWRFMYNTTCRKLRFMENNKRRIHWSRDKIGAEKARFLKLAPYLLHTEVFEHFKDMPLLPLSSCVSRYQPDLGTLELARDYFRRIELPEHQHDPVHIHGLYIIGSVGSIAQTPSSDMDFWVCYDAEDMPKSMANGLGDKLEAIEKWAMEAFGLEVHFFLMDLNLIRNNNFGFSDTESSGSAQALLLKEEFYRTAVHVAGKLPLWCVTGPEENDEINPRMLDAMEKSGSLSGLIDLGALKSIPREEFFGASLWQIVKALKSPFKSIMKFGLLEKYIYAGGGEESPLLCNKLKYNLFRGHDSLMYVDPYMLLFREVMEHYSRTRDKESMHMVQISFALKTGLRAQIHRKGPLLRPEYKEIREIFAGDDAESPMHLSSMLTNRDLSFDKLVSMGQKVNKFVIQTYTRVREEQAGLERVAITPEDLTKLGRKIFTIFSKRKNKIEHIPFVSFSEAPFRILHFSASGGKLGEPEQWEIQGAQEVSESQRLHLTNLRKGESLPELLAWLTANEIYTPGMDVRGDYSISPVTTRDLSTALKKLKAFFPASKTFNTDIAETLNPERIVRAFFLLNLVKPRESSELLSVAVIYSTNWGELFCTTIETAKMNLKDPVGFLRQYMPQETPEPPAMDWFAPSRSKCGPPNLPADS